MMVVDTSALMAILLDEPAGAECRAVLTGDPDVLISAATLAEGLIVADRRGLAEEFNGIVEGLGFEIIPVTAPTARRVAAAYSRWGKGIDPASLNFGDCFAYALAQERGCPLLFVGDDFGRTDLEAARPAPSGKTG